MNSLAGTARKMWQLAEPVHSVTYFTAEARAAFEAAGLRGFWRGYFAGRAAPLGAVQAAPVTAAFFSFAPGMVERALPAVWELATPAQALRARADGAAAALRRILAGAGAGAGAGAASSNGTAAAVDAAVGPAADLLITVAASTGAAGRPLGAANRALPVPDEPLGRLWLAATVLREHRGDGHVAALTAAGLDGCEALVLRCAVGMAAGRPGIADLGPTAARQLLQPIRGWSDRDWDAAAARLADRGWITADGSATAAGAAAHTDIEAATDLAAERPWRELGADRTSELAALLRPIALAAAAELPYPNPIGIADPGGSARP